MSVLPWRATSVAEPLFVVVVLWPFLGAQRGSAPHGEPTPAHRGYTLIHYVHRDSVFPQFPSITRLTVAVEMKPKQ